VFYRAPSGFSCIMGLPIWGPPRFPLLGPIMFPLCMPPPRGPPLIGPMPYIGPPMGGNPPIPYIGFMPYIGIPIIPCGPPIPIIPIYILIIGCMFMPIGFLYLRCALRIRANWSLRTWKHTYTCWSWNISFTSGEILAWARACLADSSSS
jgi:hypothetical protein